MTTFNIRAAFKAASQRMLAEFTETAQIAHRGGKGTSREAIISKFLEDRLPRRYSIGAGEVLHWRNKRSRQCDVLLYDGEHCPQLLITDQYSIFPLESIFASIEVKSDLTSTELELAFQNIRSVKSLVPEGSFTTGSVGFATGLSRPIPIGVVFAFSASRSMQAVLDQYHQLERDYLPLYSPDLVVVLGQGIISRPNLRGVNNAIDKSHLSRPPILRRAGAHTLLRFYLELLQQLNMTHLEPLDLYRYLAMPEQIGSRRVLWNGNILQFNEDGSIRRPLRIKAETVERIVSYCKDKECITYQRMLEDFADVSVQSSANIELPGGRVRVYNPNNRKLLAPDGSHTRGGPLSPVWIDDEEYQVDLSAFDMDVDFEDDPDADLTELFRTLPTGVPPRRRKP